MYSHHDNKSLKFRLITEEGTPFLSYELFSKFKISYFRHLLRYQKNVYVFQLPLTKSFQKDKKNGKFKTLKFECE